MKKTLQIFAFLFLSFSTFLVGINTPIDAAETFPFEGSVIVDAVVVHSEASNSSEVTQLAYGTQVTVTAKVSTKMGERYQIKYDGGKIGYVAVSCIVNVSANTLSINHAGVETYRAYCDNLIENGFIESYCPYLYYLHVKYPNWTFRADVLQYTLETVAAKEEWKVVLQTNNSNYWLSSNPIEKDYYYVNQSVISSYLDPRNSLYESRIFQFLDLEESKDIYNDVSLSAISGTGNLSNYLEEFKNAASLNGINALHIMARSNQEGANKADYAAITGLYTTNSLRLSHQGYSLDGYYNFYNIGSYADSIYSFTVQRGLAFAAGYLEKDACMILNPETNQFIYDANSCGALSYQRPWDTPQKAISGGAEFIANKFIRQGQDTNYYQKFNVSSYKKYELTTNQYMTNLYAPAGEANTMYNAYLKGGLLTYNEQNKNLNYVFVIPVYQNMKSTNYQAVDRSTDSKLSAIKLNNQDISGFDPDVVEYNLNVVTNENFVDIQAVPHHKGAQVYGIGKVQFVNGVVEVDIKVVAEDAIHVKTYHLTIKKITSAVTITVGDIVNKMDVKISGSYMYSISPNTVASTLINTVTKNGGSAFVTDKEGKSKTGSLATGDKITIKGTSESKTYTIAIRGDLSGDGLVKINDLILIQSYILNTRDLSGETLLAGDINYDGSVKINDLILVQSSILGKVSL